MRTPAQKRGQEIVALKRELHSYKVFRKNIQTWFDANPGLDGQFGLFMLSLILLPPDGGQRKPMKKAA